MSKVKQSGRFRCVPAVDRPQISSICLTLAVCQQLLCLLCFLSTVFIFPNLSFLRVRSTSFSTPSPVAVFLLFPISQHSSLSSGLIFLPLLSTHLLFFSFDLYPLCFCHVFPPFFFNIILHLSFVLSIYLCI